MEQRVEFLKNDMFYSTAFRSKYHEAFTYYLYIPHKIKRLEEKFKLIVLIHGTERSAEGYRNKFKKFAELTNSIVLAPLFPAPPIGQRQLSNYNFVKNPVNQLRYDSVLLDIIQELKEEFLIENKFYLHGFSGGGQFVHRFYYLYPELLHAVSIGAPGNITLLDEKEKWPAGIGNVHQEFQREISVEAMKKVKLQIIAGEEDLEIVAKDSAATRIDNCQQLASEFKNFGIPATFELVAGVGHNGFLIIDEVQDFFFDCIEKRILG